MKEIVAQSYKDPKKRKMKKIAIVTSIILVIVAVIVLASFYIANEKFREFFDKNILGKIVEENGASTLEINSEENNIIYAYDKYIVVLNKNIVTMYTESAKKDKEIEVNVSNPVFASNNRFLGIAQKDGQKVYLISGGNIVWQTDVEGAISKIQVNKNGYVTVIVNKTFVLTFNPEGKLLFKTYLSTTTAVDASISNDNKYLAIAEVNTTGTVIQSRLKIISMEKAKNEADSIIYTYNAPDNELIISIKYQDKNKLACLYDSGIHIFQDGNDETITDFSQGKVTIADINLNNSIVKVLEKSSGLFTADSELQMINTGTKKENSYVANGVAKSIYTYGDVVALNLGAEVHFVNASGWLIKKYTSSKEVTSIVLGDSVAGIIYKDKIQILTI